MSLATAGRLDLVPLKAGDPGMPFQSIEVDGRQFVDQIDMFKAGGDHDRIVLSGQTISSAPMTEQEEAVLGSAAKP